MGNTFGFMRPSLPHSRGLPFGLQNGMPAWSRLLHRWYFLLCALIINISSSLAPFVQGGITPASLQSLLPTLPVLLRFIDPAFARALHGGYTMLTQPQSSTWPTHVDAVTTYFAHGGSWLLDPVMRPFPHHMQLLQEVATFSGDIRSLLGEKQEQRYLIVLQNTSEKRPNGGFFGSFALVTVAKGRVKDIEIVDSYLPQYDNPDTSITGPKWLTNFLPDRQIYFVWANKVGFTYHDGPHIKNLYEKSYPGKKIRGVIFLRTDMFVDLFPEFLTQFRERQFANASIDLIRGQARRWKKELYLTSSQNFVQTHQKELIKALFTRLPELIQKRYINIYLEDISGGLHTRLRKTGLTTRFEEDTLYSRESNTSFNKADAFIKKTLTISDLSGNQLIEASGDIVSLASLAPWSYQVTITYQFWCTANVYQLHRTARRAVRNHPLRKRTPYSRHRRYAKDKRLDLSSQTYPFLSHDGRCPWGQSLRNPIRPWRNLYCWDYAVTRTGHDQLVDGSWE
jgi:hypothetical protein